MKKLTTILALALLIAFKSYSQIGFEKGYFVNESDQRIECLIKNVDWKNNPVEFEYKITDNDSVQTAYIGTVREFGIDGFSKYVRAGVAIDRSSDLLYELDENSQPVFGEEVLFLKVIVEGKATLYSYESGNLRRLFYRRDSSEIKQLVYKRYMTKNNIVVRNNSFRSQLFMDLRCEGLLQSDFEDISYSTKELTKLFIKYNEYTNADYLFFDSKASRDLLNLWLAPGLEYGNLILMNTDNDFYNTELNNLLGFHFGIDAEFILPYNKNKWGLIVSPTFASYKGEIKEEASGVSGGVLISRMDYRVIEVSVGLRHYLYLANGSSIFIEGSFVQGFGNKTGIKFLRDDGSLYKSINTGTMQRYFNVGVGYKFNDRYIVRLEYEPKHEIIEHYLFWSSEFQAVSIMFGYSIF